MYCVDCGAELTASAKFCRKCGAKNAAATSAPSVKSDPQTPPQTQASRATREAPSATAFPSAGADAEPSVPSAETQSVFADVETRRNVMPLVLSIVALVCLGAWWLVASRPSQTETDAQTPTSSNESSEIAAVPVVGTPRIEGGTLDFNSLPTYASTELTAGFIPDPYTIEVTSGGEVDASYLGGACIGYAAEAPDVRLSWSGASAQLRIFFNAPGGEDPSLLVNVPDGSWLCNDDTDGLDPEVLLSGPPEGQYDIWVGSYERDEFVSGTLSISEVAANQ